MLLSVAGMMCMAGGFDIVLIFIGLELMAMSTYVLVGFLRRDRRSNEAALKYFLLGAFSSASSPTDSRSFMASPEARTSL